MTAWIRSNVTVRQEKGIGALSFKRILAAGGGAAAVAVIAGRMVGFMPACLGGLVVLALVLAVTHPIEGLPLYDFAARSLRGLATLAVMRGEKRVHALAGQALRITLVDGLLDSDEVFDAYENNLSDNIDDTDDGWEYLGDFGSVASSGLVAADNPFQKAEGR